MVSKLSYTLKESRHIPRPFEEIAAYLIDFSTIEQWDPGVFSATKCSQGAAQTGSGFDLKLNVAGREVPMRYELLSIEHSQRSLEMVLSGEGASFSATDKIVVSANDARHCTVNYQAQISLNRLPSWLAPLVDQRMHKLGKQALDGLALSLQDLPPRPLTIRQKLSNALVLPGAAKFTRRGYQKMPHKGLSQRLEGKTWIITGPTGGIGLAAACEMARLGADIILLGRDSERLIKAQQDIIDFAACSTKKLTIIEADLATVAGCNQAVLSTLALNRPIHGLVNNAGALFDERQTTLDGIERATAINLLAPYMLTQGLLQNLAATEGQVINVASGGQYLQGLTADDMNYEQGAYDGSKAYARAKRGLVWLTKKWAAEHPAIRFSAMHPGWVSTPGLKRSLPAFEKKLQKRLRTPRMGADTIVWLASTKQPLPNGAFWFDRQAQPTDILPGTAVTADQGQKMLAWLKQQAE